MHTDRKASLIARGAELRAHALQSKNRVRASLQPEFVARNLLDRLMDRFPVTRIFTVAGEKAAPVQLIKTILPLMGNIANYAARRPLRKSAVIGTLVLGAISTFLAAKRTRGTQRQGRSNDAERDRFSSGRG